MANRSIIKALYPLQTQAVGEKIGKRILELMEIRGWNKNQLANALGVHPVSTKDWLNGEANYNLSTLVAIEQVLGGKIFEVISVNELIEQ